MSNRVIKISFDPKGTWNREEFRILFRQLVYPNDKIELFIIGEATTDIEEEYITDIQESLTFVRDEIIVGLDDDHVIICEDLTDKLEAISDNNIDIHFDSDQFNIVNILEDTECTGLFVSQETDHNFNMRYILEFKRVLKELEID